MFSNDGNDGDDNTKRPDIQERYAGAVSTGSTKVGRDPALGTAGDIVLAAGMGKYRTGQALLRLASEWHSGAVPKAGRLPGLKELARQLAKARVEEDIRCQHTDRGLTMAQKQKMRAAVTVTKADMEVAEAEQRRLNARATDWTSQENQLRFQRMKSLPAVREALLNWTGEKGWEDGEHLIASVLQRFLSPVCPACSGTALQVSPGTFGREVVRRCKVCADENEKGTVKVPHGWRGKRLLEYLDVCTKSAAHDIGQGLARDRRGSANTEARGKIAAKDEAERLTRVARVDEADAKQDKEAVAKHFKDSMGVRHHRKPKG